MPKRLFLKSRGWSTITVKSKDPQDVLDYNPEDYISDADYKTYTEYARKHKFKQSKNEKKNRFL